MVGLTELHRVQRGDVAAERLHREDGDLVADISGESDPRRGQPGGMIDRSVVPPSGNARYLPRDNLRILSARLSVFLSLFMYV